MKRASTSIMLALGLLVLAPTVSQAQQGMVYVQPPQAQPPPRTEQRSHVGMIVSGVVVLGVSYVLNGVVGLFGGVDPWGTDDAGWVEFRYAGWIPVLGPWIQLGLKPTSFASDDWATFLIVDGLIQAGGLALLIVGATVQETVTVYGDREGGGPYMALAPSLGGLQLSGAF